MENKQISNRRRWGGLAVLSLALAIIIVDTTLIIVSLRTIVKDLDTTVQNLQWVITGYSLVLSAFTITGGRFGDLFGRKRMFMLGAITFAFGSILAATAPGYNQLLIGAAVVEGLGAAMMMPATASLLLVNFQGRERAIAFGVWGGVAGAASALGPLLGGYLTSYYSWRWGYGINVVIVAVLLAFSWLVTDPGGTERRRKIDFVGILLSSLGLASIVYGIVQSSTDGWFKAKQPAHIFNYHFNLGDYSVVPLALALGVVLLIMFLMWERIRELSGKSAIITLDLFRNLPFVAGILTLAIIACGQFGTFFTLPVFFQAVRGLDAFHTGLAFLPFSLATLISAPIAGAIGSKKLAPKYLVITGLIIDVIGLLWLHNSITASATAADLRLPMIVFGIGFGMAFAQLANLTLSAVPVSEAGEASGVNNTFRQLGATFGNALLGAVLLSTLSTNFAAEVRASTKLPPVVKEKIEAGAQTQVQSLGENNGGAAVNKLPQSMQDELTRITGDAIAKSVRHALMYGVVIVGVGVIASLFLPKGGGHGTPDPTVPATPAPKPPKVEEPDEEEFIDSVPSRRRNRKPLPIPKKKPVQL